MIHEVRPLRVVAGVLFFLIGLSFFLESVSVWRVHPADFWPVLLIAIGVAVLLGRARRMKVEEDRTSQLAVAEERVRIARELHDIVAHSVSLMTIQIAAARRAKESQPEAAENSLQAAEETGRQTLAELHQMLSMLRGADASIGAAGSVRPAWSADGTAMPVGGAGGTAGAEYATTRRVTSPWPRWQPPPWPRPSRLGSGWCWPPRPGWQQHQHQQQTAAPAAPAGVWTASAAAAAASASVPPPPPPPPPAAAPAATSAPSRSPTRSTNNGRAPLPKLADLGPLVQGLRDAGLDATMTIAGSPPPLPASVELAIYRVVQEALTNALRYASQGRVLVEITYTPEYIVVFVDDEGAGPGSAPKSKDGGGHGLLGMQERIAAVGGTLTAGPRTPGPGWRVHARIPMALVSR